MRTIERSTAFKKDFKRESKGKYQKVLNDDFLAVLVVLASDGLLDVKYRDHDLTGDWITYRECHIKPDLLLIYRKMEEKCLRLARLGSHSELFG
ncbi:MAG: type II toxin-antitoxin system YafQ family toxin [Methylococcales bacterium]